MSSASVLAFTEGCTTSNCGIDTICDTGVKSRTGS